MEIINKNHDIPLNYQDMLTMSAELESSVFTPAKVNKQQVDGLSLFQKTLLVTDGTVTELLEHYLDESIKVVKLYEKLEENIALLPATHQALIGNNDVPVLTRKVLLQGQSSLKRWIYAESSILLKHLSTPFRKDLLESYIPIGKLWSKHRFESYKTDFTVTKEKANDELASYLDIPVNSEVHSRTYSVYSRGEKTMIITEKFSGQSFL